MWLHRGYTRSRRIQPAVIPLSAQCQLPVESPRGGGSAHGSYMPTDTSLSVKEIPRA